MTPPVHTDLDLHHDYHLSQHAWQRMTSRRLSPDAVRRVLNYGRVTYVRGAIVYAVGRKEVELFRREGVELSSVEGVQVVCAESDVIMTVYRNRNFRGLRPRSHRSR